MAATVTLLCLVSLTGATLALFTSNVSDGTIGIVTTAGDVRVDIVDSAGETLVGKTLEFEPKEEDENQNREVYFEPGAVYYTQPFRVENEGTIPINFRISISEDEDINMNEFRRAFDVWISRSTKLDSTAERLTEFQGRLDPATGDFSDPYYLFVRMKDTAGNEFQGKSYTGIGVTVYAVQGNVGVNE